MISTRQYVVKNRLIQSFTKAFLKPHCPSRSNHNKRKFFHCNKSSVKKESPGRLDLSLYCCCILEYIHARWGGRTKLSAVALMFA